MFLQRLDSPRLLSSCSIAQLSEASPTMLGQRIIIALATLVVDWVAATRYCVCKDDNSEAIVSGIEQACEKIA